MNLTEWLDKQEQAAHLEPESIRGTLLPLIQICRAQKKVIDARMGYSCNDTKVVLASRDARVELAGVLSEHRIDGDDPLHPTATREE